MRITVSILTTCLILLFAVQTSRISYCAEPASLSKSLIFSRSNRPERVDCLGLIGVPAYAMIDGQKVRGIFALKVEAEGQAYAAGVRKGDVFLSLNGRVAESPVVAARDLLELSGMNIDVTYARRSGDRLVVKEGKVYVNAVAADPLRFSTPGSDSQATYGKVRSKPKEYTKQELAEYMLQLVNNDRSANSNLPRLMQSAQLTTMAEKYAEDMVKRDFFGHKDPEGLGMVERAATFGITGHIAENLSCVKGHEDLRDQIKKCQEMMMNEPTDNPFNHRGNLLDKEQKSIGIGIARLPTGGVIAVQEFSHDELE